MRSSATRVIDTGRGVRQARPFPLVPRRRRLGPPYPSSRSDVGQPVGGSLAYPSSLPFPRHAERSDARHVERSDVEEGPEDVRVTADTVPGEVPERMLTTTLRRLGVLKA